ncbi:carboxypeptidase-like regulatory domain-containing protein [Flavitalea sp. BT771]|uniref:carboxypeptidase-like regulatory domain-containing protein n=1 Tax=Flavitalea sp. BT771 TaxID=3063329 RepID=UPI0026E1BBFB|nr:carboxypeptidase-like regulatory domain-containing protein [Flavitalea sp. BT771]MDO6429872.1 carboxypeptidase-like regulatory domain-containing protein [Flavitalea sp. BT771]MDV6218000.1 carboxypeptidase-like regulatory domain-containing protein [Flavitalea sp. BT771]
MRSYRLPLIFAVLSSFTIFYACNKYKDTPLPSNELPEEKTVTASVQGRVLDENGLPVQGAAVTSGTASTTTDVNGVFSFTDISLSSRFGFVKVVKQGYFIGSRSILTSAGSSNYVSITLIPRTSKGSFSASGGGSVVVETGDTVAFDGSSFVNAATNAAYSGTVHVYAAYLDPLSLNAAGQMPGDLRGIGADGKETMLRSFGMMVVELEGDGGEKLQLASGKLANITMKIPDALKATAAATIPLWYFNDTTGRWIQQGSGVRKGDSYCGQTAHFTWWNYDAPMGAVNLKLQLKDQHGVPLTYTRVDMTSPTLGTKSGYTDVTGYISGLIPKGETLQLKVMSSCGTLLAGANVGPTLADQDLGTLTVNSEIASLTLSGTVVNCNGGIVDSGYVNVVVEGLNYRSAVSKGAFTVNVTRCATATTSVSLLAGDYKTLEQGSSISLSADTGKNDAGQLTACGTAIEQYVSVTVDGKTYTVNYPVDSIGYWVQNNTSNFQSLPVTGSAGYSLGWQTQALSGTGTFPANYFYLNTTVRGFYQSGAIQCTISQFGNINEYIVGGFSGNLKDSVSQVIYPMTGNFKVRRDE